MEKEKTTGELIKLARKKAGYTQAELGEKLGVSSAAISQFEKPNANPTSETIKKIAEVLKIDPFSLYSFDMATEEIEKELPLFNSKLNEIQRRLPPGYIYQGDYEKDCLCLSYPDGDKIPCDIDEILEIINKAADYCIYELEKLRKK